MKVQYNPVQIQGMRELSKSIILSAGAGSGKTDVLTRRIVEILKIHREESIRILAITFTKKATEEMSFRLLKVIEEEGLERRDFQKVFIQTIDSFCESLLREYSVHVSLSPDFKIIEEYESDNILRESIHEVVLQCYEKESEIFTYLRTNHLNLVKWEEELFTLYREIRRKKMGDMPERNHNNGPTLSELSSSLREIYPALIEILRGNSNVKKILTSEKGSQFHEGTLSEDETLILFQTIQKTKVPTIKDEEIAISYLTFLEDFSRYKERENDDFIKINRAVLIEIEESFQYKKQRKEVLDFSDLLEFALKLFLIPDIKEEIIRRFHYILVDEFQDTNPRQVEMIKKFEGFANIFLVGDMKQSIYGFRGANLGNVLDAQAEFLKRDFLSLTLSDNYRSTEEVIAYINDFFMGKIEEYVPLQAHYTNEHSFVQRVNLREWEIDSLEAEATYIAQEARKYLDTKKTVALLVRRKTHLAIYEEVFRRFSLPFINYSSDGLFQTREVKMLKNILLTLAKPWDTLAKIGFYRSPLVGLNNSSIYFITKNQPENLSKEQKRRYAAGKKMLIDLQENVQSITKLIDRIYHRYGLLIQTEAYYGVAARENLLEVRKFAEKFDREEGEDVSSFLIYWSKLEKTDLPQAGPPMTNHALEIMTIHKAKGLQFDGVFLGDMSYGMRASGNIFNFSNEYGIGINGEDGRNYIFTKNQDLINKLDREEEIRLLYVAMTRAKENLYLLESKNEKTPSGFSKYFGEENIITPKLYEETHQVPPKESHTTTRHITFQVCNEKPVFSPSQILILPENEQTLPSDSFTEQAASLGSFLHQYAAMKLERRDARELLLRRAGGVLSKSDKIRLETLMKTYDSFDSTSTVLAAEIPFFVHFPDFRLKGSIDQIREIDGKKSIVDLKTGRSQTRYLVNYMNQVQLYGLSYERLYGEILPLYLYFLGDDSLIPVNHLTYEKFYEMIDMNIKNQDKINI